MVDTYKTNNDVPSGDPKDFHDNAMTIDEYVNSKKEYVTNRIGEKLISIFGINQLSQKKIAEFNAEIDKIIKESGAIEVVNEFGGSKEKVISQEKITNEFLNLENNFIMSAPSKPSGLCFIRKTSNGVIVWSKTDRGAVSIRVGSGNQASPSFPSNSENKTWGFYRTTVVTDILVGFMYKSPLIPDGVNMSWVSPDYLGVKPDSFSEHVKLGYLPLRSDSLRAFSQVVTPINGNIKVTFLCTSGSPESFTVNIGGVKHLISLKSTSPILKTFTLQSGHNPQEVTFESSIPGTYNLVCFNLFDIKNDDNTHASDLDSWSYYLNNVDYIYSRGASDYAVQSAKNGLWAGSYHGGEVALSDAMFVLSSGVYTHDNLPDFYISESLSILQNTKISWSTGESIKTSTNTTIGGGEIQIDGGFYDCDIDVMTAVVGMSTTSDAFTISQSILIMDTAKPGTYDFGNINYITQINPTNGMRCDSVFSKPPILKTDRGLVVSQVPKAYAKVYPPFINGMRGSPVRLPERFSFFNLKKFY